MPTPQARHWIGTIPEADYIPAAETITGALVWVRGQLEEGAGGYRHWQLVASFKDKVRLAAVTRIFKGHWEPTRSDAAREYVWKLETRVEGSQFEYGIAPFRRNSNTDWERIRSDAISGDISACPPDVYIRCYNQLQRIVQDNQQPIAMVRKVKVFWGITNSGKSHTAWDQAGLHAYGKDPRTKWWCGYRGIVLIMKVKQMLFWMNFEEISQYRISLDGLIAIRSVWKRKEDQYHWQQTRSGSPVMSIRGNGTLTWTPVLWTP
jgi:hypothetical protein